MASKVNEAEVLRDSMILRRAIEEKGITQTKLAARIGIKQNALSANICRDRMSLDNFKRILNALGYDVAVVDRESGDVRWIVDPDE